MGYTKKNLREVEDAAPKFDMPSEMQARFARSALEGKTLGLSLFTLEPGSGFPSGTSIRDRRRSTSSCAAPAG